MCVYVLDWYFMPVWGSPNIDRYLCFNSFKRRKTNTHIHTPETLLQYHSKMETFIRLQFIQIKTLPPGNGERRIFRVGRAGAYIHQMYGIYLIHVKKRKSITFFLLKFRNRKSDVGHHYHRLHTSANRYSDSKY